MFMRPGTCGSPSWQRLCRYAVYVDADLSVATRINPLVDGAGHTLRKRERALSKCGPSPLPRPTTRSSMTMSGGWAGERAGTVSINPRLAPACLHARPRGLGGEPALLGGLGGLGLDPPLGPNERFLDQRGDAGARLLTIGLTGAMAARGDEDAAVGVPFAAGEHLQPLEHRRRQTECIDVDAHLHRGRHLVDVLPAGPGRGEEALLDRIFGQDEAVRRRHRSAPPSARSLPAAAPCPRSRAWDRAAGAG